MKPELTIIIPCYNCVQTLKEAVDSCYVQNLDSFEIVMVDDGSTDGTYALMEDLKRQRDNIRIFKNEKNLGGGATRNKAVQEAQADIIFCLDSDDVLPPNTLEIMLRKLKEKKLDGITFQGGISFNKKTPKESGKKYNFDLITDTDIKIESFFKGDAIGVTANFMYTKQSFLKSYGYPTHHNFDTQGFGFRYLLAGNKAQVCPGAFFYQRQFSKDFSYFERSYNSGELSLNYFLIFIEAFELFNDNIKKFLFSFDIFQSNKLNQKNIFSILIQMYKDNSDVFFNSQNRFLNHQDTLFSPRIWTSIAIDSTLEKIEKDVVISKSKNLLLTHLVLSRQQEDKRVSLTQKKLVELTVKPIEHRSTRPSITLRIVRKIIRIIKNEQ